MQWRIALVVGLFASGCAAPPPPPPPPPTPDVGGTAQAMAFLILTQIAPTETPVPPPPTATAIPVVIPTQTPVPLAPVVPRQPVPAPAAMQPSPGTYTVGPVRIDPGTVYRQNLGQLPAGYRGRLVLSVTFNRAISGLVGIPDIDVFITGPGGVIASVARARTGGELRFTTPAAGAHELILSNEAARLNTKIVSAVFVVQ